MSHTVQALLSDGVPSAERLDRFVEENEFPIVEGTGVTFFFRGQADDVRLRHFIYGLPTSQPFHRVEGADLWHVTMELPERSRIEYKIEVIRGDDHQWVMDPLNPRVAHDPFGANSVCQGRGYEEPEWSRPDDEARPGSIEDLKMPSRAFGGARRVLVYLPARFRKRRRYPLLIAHDGGDFLRFASLKTVLDNLIHRLEIPPIVVALTMADDRLTEYGADPRHGRFLVDDVLPRLEQRYPLSERPADRGLLGASFGAVASLHAAWSHPGVFGRLGLLSGSFAFSDIGDHQRGPAFDPVAAFVNGFRENPGRPTDKIFLACGTYESLIYENRSLLPLLQTTGMTVRYVEARDGHNWENWRDRMREGLSWLYPGPLWMVYE
ncbi:MAG: enterochelin esterase [bacterium]|nr:enterochelin esterase [bacterium]